MSHFETVIGLEVHVELGTKTKIFCDCAVEFGAAPNTHVCPVCLGSPGALPVLNEDALKLAIRASLALHCTVSQQSKFDRKNYFYPDSPKAYQISQYDEPVGEHGYIEITVQGEKKRIGITRVHLEEDAGKLTHSPFGNASLVDLNRVGIPLIEIVSEPDIRTAEEARLYLEELKSIMQFCGISECKMEEGSLRCDANISLRPVGQEALGTKTEIKNMNSFRNVQRGLEYEEQRQTKLLLRGEDIVQETMRFQEETGVTVAMRSKEDAHDYRYFPEPDLPRIYLSAEYIEERRAEIPELPAARRKRFIEEYGLPAYDAEVLTATRVLSEYFDGTASRVRDPKIASNWIMGDLLAYVKANSLEIEQIKVSPEQLAALIGLIDEGTISSKMAKDVLKTMLESGKDAKSVIAEQGLVQISDEGELREIAARVIAANPKSVEDFKAGKEKAIGSLVGQMMKETKGKANPQLVNQIILDLISR
ncbi:MAG: Asp-tRNA(Asn)/Glu-tRNA(Gln) amidotransferase subunit GatB [Acidibacillus sp.]|uniref:Aspartyl/glutamyl-tRNA(Asn/Gln) amidotransferase subunit B n=1 Tax=Sulfoacidibacillus ferrooxidans TaxID=2005001 RepID=A0A9X1V7E3_9BACL|nr:Asp-tRNA(Asn)/Glu-tRNA(Gln) amidotransferase subunit GatB [Sulfoacidibacillus ferrooxidans]MCI0182552.1 Aspartyl/glutamyl-tRNA(Asn/Gln) amidotransferase subunit B [Sulfoacidibacillus ferrooxidans]MCY0894175.1 Asp-tRNA(Asn)/Glu-tRNA(Gln) amidotransferase subunit GatB [Acidibacillus sp.]